MAKGMKEYPKDVKLEDGNDIMAVQEMEKMFSAAKDARKHLVVDGDVMKIYIMVLDYINMMVINMAYTQLLIQELYGVILFINGFIFIHI